MFAKLKAWIQDKWGRFVTAIGAVASAVGTAIAALPDSAATWLPHVITLTTAKVGAGVMLIALFIASHMRHRKVAAALAQQAKPT